MRDVGDEVASHGLEPAQVGDIAEHEQGAAVGERAARDEQRPVVEREIDRLHFPSGENRVHQLSRGLVVKQLAQGRQAVGRAVAEQAPRRGIQRDDCPPRVRRQDAVRHRFDERRRLLALAPQLGEPLVELLMHGAQREDVLGDLGRA